MRLESQHLGGCQRGSRTEALPQKKVVSKSHIYAQMLLQCTNKQKNIMVRVTVTCDNTN
jgi:hypothetical protein